MNPLVSRIVSALPDRAVQRASKVKSWLVGRTSKRFYQPLVDSIFPDVDSTDMLVANDDAAVFRVTHAPGKTSILKLARTPVASELLAEESAALNKLQAQHGLGEWRSLIAHVTATGEHPHGAWFTQTDIAGTNALATPINDRVMVEASFAALEPVHRDTGEIVTVTDAVLAELISNPLALVRHWRPTLADEITMIDSDLRRRLAGRELHLSRLHGDFAPTNIVWNDDLGQLAGIIDWRLRTELAPPEADLVHFSISLLAERMGTEYGTTVIRLLDDAVDPTRAELVHHAAASGPNDFDTETGICLAWLQHIAFGLHMSVDLRTNPIWLHNNIDSVVTRLSQS